MMATITLKKIPDDIHRAVKRMQLDRDEKGEKITLEDLYIELAKEGIKSRLEQKK